VEDLVDAYQMALARLDRTAGQVYNIGGGHKNQMSLLELLAYLEGFLKRPVPTDFGDWRPGDQPVFVCDIAKARRDFGWAPRTGVKEGVRLLQSWVRENHRLFG
jgi:CDP-paratose 2-epimerase